MVFHVLNRGVARMRLFEKAADYQAFEIVLRETVDESPMLICAYDLMPNHWHLLVWPESDAELARVGRHDGAGAGGRQNPGLRAHRTLQTEEPVKSTRKTTQFS